MLKLLCLVIFLQCAVWPRSEAYNRNVVRTLTVGNGGPWGTWHRAHMCPPGSYAAGFEQRVESGQGRGDDTAGNAVRLFCKTRNNNHVDTVSSYDGIWGSWTGRFDCQHSSGTTLFIAAFSLKVEGKQGNGDDTAMNNMRVSCRSYQAGGYGYTLEGNGGPWGGWSSWSTECPAGSAVCGLAVRFEGSQGGDDDTALNDVQLYCCND